MVGSSLGLDVTLEIQTLCVDIDQIDSTVQSRTCPAAAIAEVQRFWLVSMQTLRIVVLQAANTEY